MGAEADLTGAFTNESVSRIDSTNLFQAMFNQGTVAPGDSVSVQITLFFEKNFNDVKITQSTRTTGQSIPGQKPFPPGGVVLTPPLPGGNGETPILAGGQEGGGGSGHYRHDILISNDKDTAVQLRDFKLLASMLYYEDLNSDVPWSSVLPIDLGGPSITIAAHQASYMSSTQPARTTKVMFTSITQSSTTHLNIEATIPCWNS